MERVASSEIGYAKTISELVTFLLQSILDEIFRYSYNAKEMGIFCV